MSKQVKLLTEPGVRKIVREEIENTRPKWTKDFVTKEHLDEKLDDFITKDYLDQKLDEFVTKDYLDEKLTKFRDDILTGVDEVMGELSEHTDTLENHESRLHKLEKPHRASI